MCNVIFVYNLSLINDCYVVYISVSRLNVSFLISVCYLLVRLIKITNNNI